MSVSIARIGELVVEQLKTHPEMRVLSLVVAIRKRLGDSPWKGDLTTAVNSALRTLICSKTVVQVEGMYSLAVPVAPKC